MSFRFALAALLFLAGCVTDGTQVEPSVVSNWAASVQSVRPRPQPLAARLIVVIPDRARLTPVIEDEVQQTYGYPEPNRIEQRLNRFFAGQEFAMEALRRSGIFGEIQVATRNDTRDPEVSGADFQLWLQVANSGPGLSGRWHARWLLSPVEKRTAALSVDTDPGAGDIGRIPAWVRAVEDGVKRFQAGNVEPPATAGKSSGTAFAVSTGGHVLSNSHVIEKCTDVSLWLGDGRILPARVLARDGANDLALLKVETVFTSWAQLRATPLRPGETVLAIGFPLSTLLSSSASITTGNVSALSGVKDDLRHLQFTAPVQPGNSGGPLLDSAGRLVGVVSFKLDSLQMAARTGDLPQNVNFAVKASLVQEFAASHGVTLDRASAALPALDPADVYTRAQAYTMRVDCTIRR
jgi:S1-C subfamily serine protease